MARILKQGEFKNYAVTSLERAYSPIQESFTYEKKLVTVFILINMTILKILREYWVF